ncbi:MAG: hypothetical protein ACQES7_04225 [Pseudomonadota bacterium]
MTSMNDVNLEEGRVEVEVFTQTDAALAVLREQYSTVPDFETSEGYDQGKKALKKITGYRTTLEKERKRIKAPYLEAGQIIDAEAKRITAALVELETPLKQAKAVVDEREKRMKAERIAKLQAKIDAIKAKVREARGQDSATVAAMIEEVDAIDTQGEFYELTDDAVRAQREVLDELGGIYSDRLQQEQAEEDRRKAEQARMEQEAQQRINDSIQKIRMLPLEFMGASVSAIQEQIDKMTMQYPSASQFGDRYPEAEQAHEQSMDQLRGLLAQAKQAEENAAKAEAFKEAAAMQGKVEPEDLEPVPTNEPIPADFKVDTADRLAAHIQNGELLDAISDWCDKWELSLDASLELGQIIETHCLK